MKNVHNEYNCSWFQVCIRSYFGKWHFKYYSKRFKWTFSGVKQCCWLTRPLQPYPNKLRLAKTHYSMVYKMKKIVLSPNMSSIRDLHGYRNAGWLASHAWRGMGGQGVGRRFKFLGKPSLYEGVSFKWDMLQKSSWVSLIAYHCCNFSSESSV